MPAIPSLSKLPHKRHPGLQYFAMGFVVLLVGGASAYGASPPAGQMCPEGSYVIGFDAESNIVCSDVRRAEQPPPATEPAPRAPATAGGAPAAVPVAPATVPPAPPPAELAISGVEPKWAVFGTDEVTVTVSGSGFQPGAEVVFAGGAYPASVNPAGTQLSATLPTRSLAIGAYAVTVRNAAGGKATRKRALEIY